MEKNNKVIKFYIIAFFIPVIFMLGMMYGTKCFPFGESHSVLLGDAKEQYIQFFWMFKERLAEGKSFLFSWDAGMGFDLLSSFWYYLSNPFNLIVLLFDRQHVELGMACAIMLQNGGCAVTTMYYLLHSKVNKIKNKKYGSVICVLFSTAYAMCDYILAYRFNLMWLMGMMLIPLIMLGIEYLVDKNDGRLYGIVLFLGFVSNFYFAWFLCIWAVICFIDQKKENFKHWKKSFVKFSAISVVSALCAGFVLVPSYLAVLERKGENWYSLSDFSIGFHNSLGNFFNGFFWGHDLSLIGEDFFTQNNYCGIFILVLMFVYIVNKNIDKLQKVKRIAEICVLAVSMNWIGAFWALHGFTIPHMYSNRCAFLLIFLLIISAFESLHGISEIRLRYLGVVGLFLTVFFLVSILTGNLRDSVLCYLITLLFFVWIYICLILYKRNSISWKGFIVNLCIVGFIELLTNPVISNADSFSTRTEFTARSMEYKDSYESLDSGQGERKTSYYLSGIINFSCSQTDIFSSSIHSDLLKLFNRTGLLTGIGEVNYGYVGTTPLTAALFNVRYVFTDLPARFGGYERADSYENTYDLYETDFASGFGFMLPEKAVSWDLDEKNAFEVQNNFSRDILGKGNMFVPVNFDNLQLTYSACSLLSYTATEYHYNRPYSDSQDPTSFMFSAKIPENMDLYLYIKDTDQYTCRIYIDDELMYDDAGMIMANAGMYHIGKLRQGQEIDIYVEDMSKEQRNAVLCVYFYQYIDSVMQDCLTQLQSSVYQIQTFEETYVSGTVCAEEDGILYTSIPYYRGFHSYVDGEKAEIVKVGGAMTGVRIPAGEHKVEFRYFTYGLKTGIVLSVVGIFLAAGSLIISIKKKKDFCKEREK